GQFCRQECRKYACGPRVCRWFLATRWRGLPSGGASFRRKDWVRHPSRGQGCRRQLRGLPLRRKEILPRSDAWWHPAPKAALRTAAHRQGRWQEQRQGGRKDYFSSFLLLRLKIACPKSCSIPGGDWVNSTRSPG